MKLMCELTEDINFLTEEHNGKKYMYIEGTWMQGEVPNRNRRIYPISVLEREANRYHKTYVAENRAYGELGHPKGPKINEDRISHIITELKRDGNNYIGKARLLDTPNGNIAKGIIEGGGRLGVSTRGMGSLKARKDGINEVQEDFYLATAGDIVVDPSAPDAFVNGIMEGVEWICEGGIFKPIEIDEARNSIERAYGTRNKEVRQEEIVEAFKRFFSRISRNNIT